MAAPLFKVEVAFADGPNAAAPTWTDISQYVRRDPALTYSRGSTDEVSGLQAGSMSFAVDNSNGRFTPGSSASTSAWGTVLKIRRPVRLSIWNGSSYVAAWRGTVDDWGTGWVNGVQGLTLVTCSDIVSEAGRVEFADAALEEILSSSPYVVYPMVGDATTTVVADASGSSTLRPALAVAAGYNPGGTLTLGAELGIGPDAAPGVSVVDAGVSAGMYLMNGTAYDSGTLKVDNGSIEAYVRLSPGAGAGAIVGLFNGATSAELFIDSSDVLSGSLDSGTTGEVISAATITDGELHHLGLTWSTSAGTTTVSLYVDGVLDGTDTCTSATTSLTTLAVGAYPGGTSCLTGVVGHVAAYTTALSAGTMLDHANAMNGWVGESGSARFSRLCSYARLDSSRYAVGSFTSTATMGALSLSSKTLLSALQEVAEVEQGTLYVSPAGVLTYNARASRYDRSSTLTIAPQTLEPDLSFVTNDAYLVNDATVSRSSGGLTATAGASTSLAAYGLVRRSITANVDTAEQAINLAQWLVYRYAEPGTRARSFSVNATTKAASITTTNLLALDVDSRITLSPLPNPAPASSVQLFIDGVSGSISDELVFTFNTSPTTYLDGWVLGTDLLDTGTLLLY